MYPKLVLTNLAIDYVRVRENKKYSQRDPIYSCNKPRLAFCNEQEKRSEITENDDNKKQNTSETFQDLIFADCLAYSMNENHFHFFPLHTSERPMRNMI